MAHHHMNYSPICKDSSGGYLSQRLFRFFYGPFNKKGCFFSAVIVVLSVWNSLPATVAVKAETRDTTVQEAVSEITHDKKEERCRLQADVQIFLTLATEYSTNQTRIPCELSVTTSMIPSDVPSVSQPENELLETIQRLTAGYPLMDMAPAIARYDRNIAGLIVGIAKKESNWGRRVPRDIDGTDCYNYWGYKGAGMRGRVMEHGCFGSPEEAVQVIGDRLKVLVALRQTSDPKNMVIWKCGSSCRNHSSASVQQWIDDVTLYYNNIASR
ncbi:MAG: hypothetical protein ACSLEX_00440 [Minisyncoccota bacterium]